MKNVLLLSFILVLTATNNVFAQYDVLDFESGGLGAGFTWIMDNNASNTTLTFPANPVSGGINTSATVAQFDALQAGNPWALTFTSDIDAFQFDATNSTVTIKVYKTLMSPVGIKFEGSGAPAEILITNTTINQWEEMTFDFSAHQGITYNKLIVLPDFDAVNYVEGAGRAADHTIYFDDIQVPDGNVTAAPEPTTAAPTPTHDEVADNVLSVFSDAYTDIVVTDFAPNWGEGTDVVIVDIAGNPTLAYTNLSYQGTILGSAQDVSGHGYFHIDFWAPTAGTYDFYLISEGPPVEERKYTITSVAEQWVSVDIPLHTYVSQGLPLTDIFQFKIVGTGNVWFDNWYFHSDYFVPAPVEPATAAPTPTHTCGVVSIFSDAYTNVGGTDLNPNWGQATVTTEVMIQGNNTLKYANLNYQGTQFGTPQDVSDNNYLHVDFWTADATALNFYLISSGTEVSYSLPIQLDQWVSVDIPLSTYETAGDLTSAIQFKVDGNGTIFFDNLYFHGNVTLPPTMTPATLTCTVACEEEDWTMYEDAANPGVSVFAIDWDPNGTGNNAAAKAGATVTIDIAASETAVVDGDDRTWTMGRYWNISTTGTLVDPVNVRFFYDAAEKAAIEAASNSAGGTVKPFEWFKTTGVNFDPSVHVAAGGVGGDAIILTDANTGGLTENGIPYAQFDGITSFSGGTGATGTGAGNIILPVELTYFEATAKGERVELNWETASETNNDYFEVEHAVNGVDFRMIDMVQGAGNSAVTQSYTTRHNQPANGLNYYRLKQVDMDGKFSYSPIATVKMENTGLTYTMFPNPATEKVELKFQEEIEGGKVQIFNSIGQLVLQETLNLGSIQQSINLNELPNGAYLMSVEMNGTVHRQALVIQ